VMPSWVATSISTSGAAGMVPTAVLTGRDERSDDCLRSETCDYQMGNVHGGLLSSGVRPRYEVGKSL
jgi:hypothetical protein